MIPLQQKLLVIFLKVASNFLKTTSDFQSEVSLKEDFFYPWSEQKHAFLLTCLDLSKYACSNTQTLYVYTFSRVGEAYKIL